MQSPRVLLLILLAVSACFAGIGDGKWLTRVPARERERSNPLAKNADMALAGRKLYLQNCADCHGKEAEGDKGPGLRSGRIAHATDGELQWILKNGSLRNGMPAWSQIPEPMRWQIVAYLRSLK